MAPSWNRQKNTRDPVLDHGISQVYREYHSKNDLPSNLKVPVTKGYIRVFTWFSDSIVPKFVLDPFVEWSKSNLIDSRDVTFVTHIMFGYFVFLPSFLVLFYSFNWFHAIFHVALCIISIPPFILMLHCVCHKKSGNSTGWWIDASVHYVLAPIYGQTWNTFYFHHTKHHHIEDNGPEDLSSTIWYQRDNFLHFLHYYFRFYFCTGIELTWYFLKRGKTDWAYKTFCGEYGTFLLYYVCYLLCQDIRPIIFGFFVPLNLTRIGMMSGNWTQHAFLDQDDALNDYKTALTCVDCDYNHTCFNDGYHTSHHLNPVRHWQDHPEHFINSLDTFKKQKVVIFRGLDYFQIFVLLMMKQHKFLAEHMLFMEKYSVDERIAYLKARLVKLTPEQVDKIRKKQ